MDGWMDGWMDVGGWVGGWVGECIECNEVKFIVYSFSRSSVCWSLGIVCPLPQAVRV